MEDDHLHLEDTPQAKPGYKMSFKTKKQDDSNDILAAVGNRMKNAVLL
jgi:hypothetical protein